MSDTDVAQLKKDCRSVGVHIPAPTRPTFRPTVFLGECAMTFVVALFFWAGDACVVGALKKTPALPIKNA